MKAVEEKNGRGPGQHSRKKLDLTGQRFGKLTVLRPAENVGRRTAWLCSATAGIRPWCSPTGCGRAARRAGCQASPGGALPFERPNNFRTSLM